MVITVIVIELRNRDEMRKRREKERREREEKQRVEKRRELRGEKKRVEKRRGRGRGREEMRPELAAYREAEYRGQIVRGDVAWKGNNVETRQRAVEQDFVEVDKATF